ncbi:MAG: helix-turn-helix domain-containing protein [Acidimicrobiia bacterium]
MVPRNPRRVKADSPAEADDGRLDVNAIVSFNVKAIRERRGMTQTQVAERLAQLTGNLLPQASISAMERGFDGERRRRFDAHELYLLSHVFGVPIAYFFLPPPGHDGELADTHRSTSDVYVSLLGQDWQLDDLDDRLRELKLTSPEEVTDLQAALYVEGEHPHNWHQHFRTWRRRRLSALAVDRSDHLDEVAEFLVEIGTKIRELGPKGYFLSHSFEEGDDPNAGMASDKGD